MLSPKLTVKSYYNKKISCETTVMLKYYYKPSSLLARDNEGV